MYYRLTYISSSDKKKVGDSVLNGNKPLDIGQGVFCDVQIPESELYESYLFATIIPIRNDIDNKTESTSGWYVVKRSDCHRLSVNGIDIDIAQVLKNGDVISFFDTGNNTSIAELKFEEYDDGEFDASSGFVYKKHNSQKSYSVAATVLAFLAFGIAVFALLTHLQKDLRNQDWSQFSQSIYHITTDSVYLICNITVDSLQKQIVTDSVELEMAAEGTAFLTSDNLFVTARHCIEPWIAEEKWEGKTNKTNLPPEVRLAIKAETENRIAGYDKYSLRAHCVISKGFERYDCYSTAFQMNKSRDMVIRLGTPRESYYWRSIIPLAHRRDMELDDFAYIKINHLTTDPSKSCITMAGWEDLVAFSKAYNHDIAVIGYPLNDNDADVASTVYGNLMGFEYNDSLKAPVGCLQLSALINPGNSGGPVFAKIGKEIKVIGIVSKADDHATQGMFWAVPITEVTNMHLNGDSITEDTSTYRR